MIASSFKTREFQPYVSCLYIITVKITAITAVLILDEVMVSPPQAGLVCRWLLTEGSDKVILAAFRLKDSILCIPI